MTVVLVHGNPETDAVWDPLTAALRRDDVVRLSPPGFGTPPPDGWTATPEAYRRWLVDQLEKIGHPVDLVGHDWGGAHVINLVMTRPDLVRTWSTDSIGMFDPGYTWHGLARVWQTPGSGEAAAAQLTHPDAERRIAYLSSIGVPSDIAMVLAPGCADISGDVMLALYRHATQPALAALGDNLPAARQRPGLVLLPTADNALGDEETRRRCADRAGATVTTLPGLGHWWMLQQPALAAATLSRFWSSAPSAAGRRQGTSAPAGAGT
ncbi:alpha/beta hydrolase [Asanoa sp. NPDC049573]|uniref:alpha/beta fold hydrolase n=1 Tax=Asanoa sp. NPDC049573 TaxID=3155396 RepID=UPI003431257C